MDRHSRVAVHRTQYYAQTGRQQGQQFTVISQTRPDAMKERSLPLPGGCWKLRSIRLHQEKGGPNGNSV